MAPGLGRNGVWAPTTLLQKIHGLALPVLMMAMESVIGCGSDGTSPPRLADHTLTSIEGDGVIGSPATGSSSHTDGTRVSYHYAPASGFSSAVVEIDGVVSPSSGTVTMSADHWIWAFGQPLTGTDFANSIAVPNDPVVIPYPAFYTNQPSALTVRVTDPYCAVQSKVIAYPHSFLGSFPMPAVQGAPLPASVLRGVGLKDYWNSYISNATLNGCLASMRDAFTATVPRVQRLGADHLSVTTWAFVVDGTSATPSLDLAHPEIPESEMAFIASTASTAGIDVWLYVNIPSSDEQGRPLPTAPTQEWEAAFLDSYAQFIVQTAQLAQKYGFKAMMLNWRDFYIDLTPYEDVYAAKMTAALSQVRSVFQGRMLFYDVVPGDPSKFAALFNGVDAIMNDASTNLLTSDENQSLTLALVKQKYRDMFGWMAQKYAPFSKPLVINAFVQSHRDFLVTGWVEDGFCVNGCIQNTLQTDFSVQAIAYEALLEAAKESGMNLMSFEAYGYWYVDVILPDRSFPNTSQSPRNKPAEAIIQRWFVH